MSPSFGGPPMATSGLFHSKSWIPLRPRLCVRLGWGAPTLHGGVSEHRVRPGAFPGAPVVWRSWFLTSACPSAWYQHPRLGGKWYGPRGAKAPSPLGQGPSRDWTAEAEGDSKSSGLCSVPELAARASGCAGRRGQSYEATGVVASVPASCGARWASRVPRTGTWGSPECPWELSCSRNSHRQIDRTPAGNRPPALAG